jgi:hypothetical protein
MKFFDHGRQLAESRLRRDLARAQDTILEYHCGNGEALSKAQDHGRRLIMEAVRRNDIPPVVAESLKIAVERWVY